MLRQRQEGYIEHRLEESLYGRLGPLRLAKGDPLELTLEGKFYTARSWGYRINPESGRPGRLLFFFMNGNTPGTEFDAYLDVGVNYTNFTAICNGLHAHLLEHPNGLLEMGSPQDGLATRDNDPKLKELITGVAASVLHFKGIQKLEIWETVHEQADTPNSDRGYLGPSSLLSVTIQTEVTDAIRNLVERSITN